MDKKQLLKGINAICDAEIVLHACNSMISLCRNEINLFLRSPRAPQNPPQRRTIQKEALPLPYDFMDFLKMASFIFFPVVFGLVTAFALYVSSFAPEFEQNVTDEQITMISACIFIVSIIVTAFVCFFRIRKANKDAQKAVEDKYNTAVEDEENRYQFELKRYNTAQSIHNRKCKILVNARLALEEIQNKQASIQSQLRSRLDSMYQDLEILPNFRSLLAMYQIRDYLTLGLSDELQGPGGAYLQYLQDIRENRLCTSINDLQHASGTCSFLQKNLITDLTCIRHNLDALSTDLHRGIQLLFDESDQSPQHIEHNLTAAEQYLSNIEHCAAVTAYNQFIAQRMQSVDSR